MYHIPVSETLFYERGELGVLGMNFGLVLCFIFYQIVDVHSIIIQLLPIITV